MVPSSDRKNLRVICRGKRALIQRGRFVGLFVFRGVPGMRRTRHHRLGGLQVQSFREVSRGPDAGPQPGLAPETNLQANSAGPLREVSFRSTTRSEIGGHEEEFEAHVEERNSGMLVDRGILAGGSVSPGQFNVDLAAGRAEVSPPAPFSGQGIFEASQPAEKRWSGELAAECMGIGKVSLAGSMFSAKLTQRNGGSP